MKPGFFLLVSVLSLVGLSRPALGETDVCVYGGTPAGVVAAVQSARMGKSVVLVAPERHLGGIASSGLGFSDTGNQRVIGGLSREFYHRVWEHYSQPGAWKWQPRSAYANQGQGTRARDDEARTMWIFEPHVAEQIFEAWLSENHVPVERDQWLERAKGVRKEKGRLLSFTTLSGKTYRAKMFIDATYEGDLMAAAGVEYCVGREAQSVYGERWNGVQVGVIQHSHNFTKVPEKISPYVVAGEPSSGVLARISTAPPGDYGQGDKKLQAYCYRLCLTDNPANRVAFPKPEHYDPAQYELLLRILKAGWRETFVKFDRIPNLKTDVNNHGPFSTDNIGYNYDYPEASYERRRELLQEHRDYQQGWFYFVANDSRVPAEVQERMKQWGLARDEFADNNHWPYQIYIREARRMVGAFVMSENQLTRKRPTPEPVGMGSYAMDSHNVQRYITPEGFVENEGDIGYGLSQPYQIAYGSLVPKAGQCDNLLVPVCLSSSHIAFGSIRMEPVFMILGQSAATAAALALDAGLPVQALPYAQLRERLLKDGQVLDSSGLLGKAAGAPKAAASDSPNPLAPISDEPGLPRVLLIGDSISIGYTLPVRRLLQGQANVHRIPANGASSANGLKSLAHWLGAGKWDVIHFNFGIHDAKFMAPGQQQVSHADYEANLRELVKRLQATHAKLVWCTTTPIPPDELVPRRKFDDITLYNAIAAKVMAELGVAVDDLYGFIRPHTAECQVPHDVHFTPAGSELLARQVADALRAQLPGAKPAAPKAHSPAQ